MAAIGRALEHFASHLVRKPVVVRTDNQVAKSYINRHGGTKIKELAVLTDKILSWAEINLLSIRAVYIAGAVNIRADNLSQKSGIFDHQ